ncbi:MAG TPA: tyrosine--tRNA ligase [Candidatus Portnoybacteria bacterium]|nr:tyrosine--tRNA ligase [Candidatus Portnoybacteria bacterium]
MRIKPSQTKIEELLSRGVEEVIVCRNLERKLKSGRKLRIKLGADPSAPDLHLGHAVVLKKLREFQDLGHKIIFIIGDFTALIGDPSSRSKTRPQLSKKVAEKNAQTYLEQVGKILDVKKAEIRRNSQWFSKVNLEDCLKLAGKFTVARILERDDFDQRIKKGQEIGLHEIFYPMMQAYDSVMIKADVEIGGTDQKFNMLAGHDLQRKLGQGPQDIITCPLLIGTDGKQKMSKTLDNFIGLTESPNEQYGKSMSIPDKLIIHYFELATRKTQKEINQIKKDLRSGQLKPREAKAQLAREIVAIYHTKKAARQAEKEFNRVFSQKERPSQIKAKRLKGKNYQILDLLVELKLAPSKSEARRLVAQKGVRINGQVAGDWKKVVRIKQGMVIQVGKRKFIKIARPPQ